jgi:hypothetical protein
MKLVSLVVLLIVSALLANAEFQSRVQSAANIYCLTPTRENGLKLRAALAQYQTNGKIEQEIIDYAQGILSGDIKCRSAQRQPTSDGVSIVCDTTPVSVTSNTGSASCSAEISLSSGIYYYAAYAYYQTSDGYTVSVSPSNSYYYDESAAMFDLSETFSIPLPQYAPDGQWSFYVYAYGPSYATYATNTAYFYVATGVNDRTPPTLKNITFPVVDSLAQSTGSASYKALDDLTGVKEVSVYFYDANYANYLGSGYDYPTTTATSVTGTVSFYLNSNAPFGTYNAFVTVYDVVGFARSYDYTTLSSLGFQSYVINAGNNCTAGTFQVYGATGPCTKCPAGTYSGFGAIACTVCPPGTRANGVGASSCIQCPSGYFSNGGNAASCTKCPAGKYSSNPGSQTCTPCSPGQYSSLAGATSCSYCTSGNYSCAGASACTRCAKGTYQPSYYASYCIQCPAGQYSDVLGATSCQPCPAGTYSNAVGTVTCTACPVGKTGPAGSNAQLSCV